MTTPRYWQEIDRIVSSALEHEPAERAAFLDEVCGGDEHLRKEVDSLPGARPARESGSGRGS